MDAQALVSVLCADGSPLPASLAELVADQLLSQSLDTFVTADDVLRACHAAGTREHLAGELSRHGQAGVARVRAAVAGSGETLGDAVPASVRQAVLDMRGGPGGPRLHWLVGCADPTLLRALLTPVFQEFLLGFVSRIPAALGVQQGGEGAGTAGAGATGGLLGRLGKEVGMGTGRRLVDFGRNVMGGLGLDLEQRVQALAREFAQGAGDAFRRALQRRLESAEGRELTRQLIERGVDRLLEVPVAEIDADLAKLPPSAVMSLLPDLIAHNLERPLGRDLLAQEVRHWYAHEGQRPLSSWLVQVDLAAEVREQMVARVTDQARLLFASTGFAAWVEAWLAQAQSSQG